MGNLAIDNRYLKLIDFGFSKVITSKTYTLCGTPEYLSPEVILGRGYDLTSEYISLLEKYVVISTILLVFRDTII